MIDISNNCLLWSIFQTTVCYDRYFNDWKWKCSAIKVGTSPWSWCGVTNTGYAHVYRICQSKPDMPCCLGRLGGQQWGLLQISLPYDSLYRLCPCMPDMPMYTGYAHIYRICPYIPDIPMYTGYAHVCRICPCIPDMPIYTGYAYIYRICPYIPDMPMYTGYAHIYRICPCVPDMPMYKHKSIEIPFKVHENEVVIWHWYLLSWTMKKKEMKYIALLKWKWVFLCRGLGYCIYFRMVFEVAFYPIDTVYPCLNDWEFLIYRFEYYSWSLGLGGFISSAGRICLFCNKSTLSWPHMRWNPEYINI